MCQNYLSIWLGEAIQSTTDLPETLLGGLHFSSVNFEDLNEMSSISPTSFKVPFGPKSQWILWLKPFVPDHHWFILMANILKSFTWIKFCLKFSAILLEYPTNEIFFSFLSPSFLLDTAIISTTDVPPDFDFDITSRRKEEAWLYADWNWMTTV